MNEQPYDYARHAARALMRMKGETVESVCKATGINEQSFEMFMRGNDAVLSDASFHSIFRQLGVVATPEGAKLDSTKVHYFEVNYKVFHRKEAARNFKTVLPLMDGVTALELPRHKDVVPILIRGQQIRVVLLVHVGLFGAPRMADFELVPGSFRGYESISKIPGYYLDLLLSKQLRANYFDLVLEGDFDNESINLVRLVALDRDVTLCDIVSALVRNEVISSNRIGDIDAAAHFQEKVHYLFPSHFRTRVAA